MSTSPSSFTYVSEPVRREPYGRVHGHRQTSTIHATAATAARWQPTATTGA